MTLGIRSRLFGWADKVVLQHLLVALVGSLLLVAALELAGTRPRPSWFVAMGLAFGFCSLAVRLMSRQLLETPWPAWRNQHAVGRWTRSNDKRTGFLATWISESSREHRPDEGSFTFVQQIRPLLFGLTRDRLLHRHGIDIAQHPEEARELTGDQLWALISDNGARIASFTQIELVVRAIEGL